MSALKPCPFCGGEAQLHFGAVEFFDVEVQCKACGVVSGNYGDGTQEQNEAAAIAAWNRRAGDGEVEKLRVERDQYAEQHRSAIEQLTMLASELAAAREQEARLKMLLRRYRDETPLGHQPHMIAHQVDAALGDAT